MRTISTHKLMALVSTVRNLVDLGRPLNKSIHDVSSTNSLSATDVADIMQLLPNEYKEGASHVK